jgi:16S rRNA (cytidine1402-2'-O)-methyltransferase
LNTPIGNLGDLTPRVFEALKTGQVFAVEDTRVFRDLLNHLGISVGDKKIFSLHDHSGTGQIKKLIELAQGRDLYVASEAGSPVVSDPAYPLVLGAIEAGLKVESFSGVSSPIMALELSGLPPIPFQFHGFLPRESSKRKRIFSEVGSGTHIFFEAPGRIEETMADLVETLPEVSVAIVRELSKKFEEVLRFRALAWHELREKMTIKGEFVLLFHVGEGPQSSSKEVRAAAQELLATGTGPKQIAKLLGLILDRPTKEIYSILTGSKRN